MTTDGDELLQKFEEQGELYEHLMAELTKEAKDIKKMKRELDALEEDIRASESQDNDSGVAQS